MARKISRVKLAKDAGVDPESESMAESLDRILSLPAIPQSIIQMMDHLEIEANPKNLQDCINLVAVAQAVNGSYPHYKEILDRKEGKVGEAKPEVADEASLIIKVKKKSVRVEKRKAKIVKSLSAADQARTIDVKAKVVPADNPKTTKAAKKTVKRKLGTK